MDESDRFMMDPSNFVSGMLRNKALPSHLVLFDTEERHLYELLESHSYKEVKVTICT